MLSFEIFGDRAFFGRPGMTTSQASLPFPPPTAILGLICAIVGIDRGNRSTTCADYWDAAPGTAVGVQVVCAGRPVSMGHMHRRLDCIGSTGHQHMAGRQMIADPRFRIFVDGPLEDLLDPALSNGDFAFPPCLGASWAPAEVVYEGRFDSSPVPAGSEVMSIAVVPAPVGVCPVDFSRTEGDVFRERLVCRMDRDRRPAAVIDSYYSRAGSLIAARQPDSGEVFHETLLHQGHIALFPRF